MLNRGLFHEVIKGISKEGVEVSLIRQRNMENKASGMFEIRVKEGYGKATYFYGMHPDYDAASMIFDDAMATLKLVGLMDEEEKSV